MLENQLNVMYINTAGENTMNEEIYKALEFFDKFQNSDYTVVFESVPDGLVPPKNFDYHIHKHWELKFLKMNNTLCIQPPQTVHCATGYDYVLAVSPSSVRIGEWMLDTDTGDESYNLLPELLDTLYRLPRDTEYEKIRQAICKAVMENIRLILKKWRNGMQIDMSDRDLAERVLDYINNHYFHSELSVNDIARFSGISPQRLNILLHRKNGQGIRQNLIRIRLEHAAELLENPECQVQDAAALTGWKSPFYFSNSFKKHFGCTPGKYYDEYISRDSRKNAPLSDC